MAGFYIVLLMYGFIYLVIIVNIAIELLAPLIFGLLILPKKFKLIIRYIINIWGRQLITLAITTVLAIPYLAFVHYFDYSSITPLIIFNLITITILTILSLKFYKKLCNIETNKKVIVMITVQSVFLSFMTSSIALIIADTWLI